MQTRIAPTPSGFLHVGNLFSFTLTSLLAKKNEGQLLLRIDDLDAPRIRQEYLYNIFYWLNELGIKPDDGPVNESELQKTWSQKHRLGLYHSLIHRLIQSGRTYACYCSRAQLQQRPCPCKSIKPVDEAKPNALKLSLPGGVVKWNDAHSGTQHFGLHDHNCEVVIRTRQGLPAYHIASICDDVLFKINYIVRGQDLLETTAVQLSIAKLAALDSFTNCTFHHHPIITLDGRKLSKSAGDGIISSYVPEATAAIKAQIEKHLRSHEQYRGLL